MHLEPPPGASLVVRVALSSVLWVHILGGAGGVLSGFIALFLPKGSIPHRRAGDLFVLCLLVMGISGAATAPFLPMQPSQRSADVLLGVFACYLAVSGWATARQSRAAARISRAAILVPILTALAVLAIAMMWVRDIATYGTVQTVVMFVLAGLIATCAVADASVILRGALGPRQRVVRHLWRMCTGLLLATAGGLAQSGVVQALPKAWRTPMIISSPVILVLLCMVFWLVRVRFTHAWGEAVDLRRASAAGSVETRPHSVR